MMVNCPICGKLTCIHWPEHWVYRRGSTYYCGENCMDISIIRDTKLLSEIGRKRRKVLINMSDTRRYLKPAEREEALELCNDRGKQAAVDYLTKIGIPNPEKCLKNLLARFKDTTPAATVKVDGPIRIQTKEPERVIVAAVNEKPETAGPIKRMKRYSVTAIRYPEIGEFYYDQKYNQIDWRTSEGDEVSMDPSGWKLLLQDLPEIFEALGVNV